MSCRGRTYTGTPSEGKGRFDIRLIHLVAGYALQCVSSPRRIGLHSTSDDGAIESLQEAYE